MVLAMTRWLIAIALLSGCVVPPTQSPATLPAPVAAAQPEPDDGLVTVSGRVFAYDGSPLRKADVMVMRPSFDEAPTRVDVDAQGRFSLEVAPGSYYIVLGAVDHRAIRHSTVVSDDLLVEGTLGTYARPEPGDTIRLRSEWLDAAGKKLGDGPPEAHRTGDVFHVELGATPAGAVRMRYQLALGSITYNGPTADSYESDQGGDYWSVVELGDRSAIDLDLRKLPPAGREAKLLWRGEDEATRLLVAFLERYEGELDAWRRAIPLKDGKIMAPSDEDRAKVAAIASAAAAEVDATKDARIQTVLRAAYVGLFAVHTDKPDDQAALRERAMWIFEHVPADEPRLELVPNVEGIIFRALEKGDAELVTRGEAWLDRRARESSEPGAAASALELLIALADRRHDDARVRVL
jgi:hypothetical protein